MWNVSELHSRRAVARRRLSEEELVEAWEQRAYAGHYLVDCCGRHFQVVFPGRRWGGPGPDFVGAVLAQRDGTLLRGDVEVHVRASSWAAHRHAADPAYQRVVLHVVHDADVVAVDARGGHLPTVQLEPEPGRGPPGLDQAPCVREAPKVLQIVEAAGRERFLARVARFEGDLNAVEADQVLWHGVAEALGYRRNSRPFGQLAEAVPWTRAASLVIDRGPVGLAGVLLGAGGLLAQTTLPEAHAWRAAQRAHALRPVLRPDCWDRRQLRATNAPEQRCRGLAELATRWVAATADRHTSASALAGLVLDMVHEAAAARHPKLWRLAEASPWIGRGRAQVIVINVLLPFAAAAGVDQARALYLRSPGEPSNRIVRYMARQLGAPAIRFRGACQQQGLLQLFKLTCAARVCERCPARAGRSERNNFEVRDV